LRLPSSREEVTAGSSDFSSADAARLSD